ncbi:DUF2239 family protein [Ramlibacter sp. AN1015]|uniref:DUF2239 family protein n=1 Tax=Ramlibacter sp. AN1015 TaxID=3133428 RepID=UPI0030C4EFE5
MTDELHSSYSAFLGGRRIAAGALHEVALALLRLSEAGDADPAPLVFSDENGTQIDLDLRGGETAVLARYRPAFDQQEGPPAAAQAQAPRARGRPRMGVVAREVTLLPEHWEWLAAQPGGASVALRKLVHQASRAGSERERQRRAQERSYRVMVALAGDRPGFEDAARALFAGDLARTAALASQWPRDVCEQVLRLADPRFQPSLRVAGAGAGGQQTLRVEPGAET